MKRWIVAAALSLLPFTGRAEADVVATVPPTPSRTSTLTSVVVRPAGPAIWKFQRGQKTIWVLGTYLPLPKDILFDTGDIERHVAQSQAVLGSHGLVTGDNIGIFRGLTLWPSIRRNKFNSDNETLREVVPPDTYARWLQAKAKYIGDDKGVESLRPMYAAFELFEAAMKKSNLSAASRVGRVIDRAATRNDVPFIDAKLRLAISNPKNTVKGFDVNRVDDVRCLEQTLHRLDDVVHAAQELGEAWATGDVDRFSAMASERNVMDFCWARLTNEAIGRQQGISDVYRQVDVRWLEALNLALREHDTVFTTLHLRDLIEVKGPLTALQREGFQLVRSSTSEYGPDVTQ